MPARFLLALVLAVPATAQSAWLTDYQAACAQAVEEQRDVLVEFTGSDWCSWCARLDEEIFASEAFVDYAAEHFVLLRLDFPRKTALPEALQAQNDRLQMHFGIDEFPTVLLLTAEGLPYAQTGFEHGGGAAYVEMLQELLAGKAAREEAWRRAATQTGAEQVRSLATGFEHLPAALDRFYRDRLEAVAAAWPSDDQEHEVWQLRLATAKAAEVLVGWDQHAGVEQWRQAAELVTAALEEMPAQGLPTARLHFRAGLAWRALDDKEKAIAAFENAIAAAPELRSRLAGMIAKLRG